MKHRSRSLPCRRRRCGPPVAHRALSATAMIEVPAEAGPLALRQAASAGDAEGAFRGRDRAMPKGRGTQGRHGGSSKLVREGGGTRLRAGAIPDRQSLREGPWRTRDLAKAKTWYQLAAEQGNASAMHNLAVLFAMGTDGHRTTNRRHGGSPRQPNSASRTASSTSASWPPRASACRRASKQSYKWFALVAKTGDKDAADKRDEVANSLRPEQLERARAATELWKPKPLDAKANSVDIPDSGARHRTRPPAST